MSIQVIYCKPFGISNVLLVIISHLGLNCKAPGSFGGEPGATRVELPVLNSIPHSLEQALRATFMATLDLSDKHLFVLHRLIYLLAVSAKQHRDGAFQTDKQR